MSDPVKRDPILDQFSMITRPYTKLNGLKTVPFPAALTYPYSQYMESTSPPVACQLQFEVRDILFITGRHYMV